jgi:hypothetical protein
MKVYIVHYVDEMDNSVIDKAFKEEKKARDYIHSKYETTDFGWFFEELEVEG